MENCPVCNAKIKSGKNQGFLGGYSNYLLSDNITQKMNNRLPEVLKFKEACYECLKSNPPGKSTVAESMVNLRNKLKEENVSCKNEAEELTKEVNVAALKNVKYYSNTPANFTAVHYIDAVVMFDSGSRSTSSDNLEGAWNVIHDEIAIKLGSVKNVEKALELAKAQLQSKCFSLECDKIANVQPTYSDLAANGKILIHLSGTAGYINKADINEESLSRIKKIKELNERIQDNKSEITNLQNLYADMREWLEAE